MVFNVGGVYVMTRAAGAAFFLVHMKPVEIDVPVSEVCYGQRLPGCHQRLFVTEETETVLSLFISSVKFVRKRQPEDECVVRAVGVMAGSAIALHYGAVLKLPLLPHAVVFVAGVAEGVDLAGEQIFPFRKMR